MVSIQGEVISIKNEYTRQGKKIQKAMIADASGEIQAVWFNQPFIVKIIFPGRTIGLSGKVDWFGSSLVLVSPEYEILKDGLREKKETVHTGRLVPIYHETYGLSSKWLRSRIAPLMKKFVPGLKEFLPSKISKKYKLIKFNQALQKIHFPTNQKKAFREIFTDLEKDKPMNRLLEGDVGSGKTVVAAVAIYLAFLNKNQAALMAPTQILANQHYQTLSQILSPLGVKVALLTASQKKTVENFDCLIGTHALIYQRAQFKQLGLVVIDEQHRFGVEQRGKLIKKKKVPPLLTMPPTPIPRTVALTL